MLIDPVRQLDHFYEALLRGGQVRVLHYGDSPTTADLITADVRGMLQKQFGDAGAGFAVREKWSVAADANFNAAAGGIFPELNAAHFARVDLLFPFSDEIL